MVCETEACVGPLTDSMAPAWDSLSPSLSLPLPCLHVLSPSLKINKINRKKKKLINALRLEWGRGWNKEGSDRSSRRCDLPIKPLVVESFSQAVMWGESQF